MKKSIALITILFASGGLLAKNGPLTPKKGSAELQEFLDQAGRVIKVPENTVKAAKKVFTTIDILNILSEHLLAESQKIKNSAIKIASTKVLHEKIELINNIVGKNIRPFVQMGIYPLMNTISDLLKITGMDIVGVFDPATGKTISDISDQIQKLKTQSGRTFSGATGTLITKAKNEKSIIEYIEFAEKILKEAQTTFKNTNWFLNTSPALK